MVAATDGSDRVLERARTLEEERDTPSINLPLLHLLLLQCPQIPLQFLSLSLTLFLSPPLLLLIDRKQSMPVQRGLHF